VCSAVGRRLRRCTWCVCVCAELVLPAVAATAGWPNAGWLRLAVTSAGRVSVVVMVPVMKYIRAIAVKYMRVAQVHGSCLAAIAAGVVGLHCFVPSRCVVFEHAQGCMTAPPAGVRYVGAVLCLAHSSWPMSQQCNITACRRYNSMPPETTQDCNHQIGY
jgi:hypothetical protein